MDNMLYIIVGLVVVLLVAVLVMRKNKAQRPVITDKKGASVQARVSPTIDSATLDRTSIDGATIEATKFDSITIAQRFIDQQRYDKAIEALERGLTKKPYDSALLLKLLDIYVATNQNDDFYRTYNTIQTHSDPSTIEQATQLKNSMGGSHSELADSTVSMSMDLDPLDTSATIDTEPMIPVASSIDSTLDQDDLSLDFDTSYAAAKEPTLTISADSPSDAQDNNNFDLTLDDLEALNLEPNNDILVEDQGAANSSQTIDNVDEIDNIDDDFNFAFDDSVEDKAESLTAQPIVSTLEAEHLVETGSDAPINELSTSELSTDKISFDDDFVLDLADDSNDKQPSANKQLPTTQSDMQDFAFNLDDDDTASLNDELASSTSADILDAQSEDISFDLDNLDDLDNLESDELAANELIFDDSANDTFDNITTVPTVAKSDAIALASSRLSNNNLTIDTDLGALNIDSPSDGWLIDDNFIADLDEPIDSDSLVTASVTQPSFEHANEQSPVDFDAQFSADFDFVKSLDSQQVTLDLADQYLQLGQYDSARRLLTEVVEQGSSEQQHKAQALLARTT